MSNQSNAQFITEFANLFGIPQDQIDYQIKLKAERDALAAKLTADWSAFAGEPVRVEVIHGETVAYGSEVACRKIAASVNTGIVKHAPNIDSWVFNASASN